MRYIVKRYNNTATTSFCIHDIRPTQATLTYIKWCRQWSVDKQWPCFTMSIVCLKVLRVMYALGPTIINSVKIYVLRALCDSVSRQDGGQTSVTPLIRRQACLANDGWAGPLKHLSSEKSSFYHRFILSYHICCFGIRLCFAPFFSANWRFVGVIRDPNCAFCTRDFLPLDLLVIDLL